MSRGYEALVLAGGKGTRLRGVVADRPKPMALVGGRPFLEYLFEQLADAGIGHAVLCLGYLGEQIRDSYGERQGSLRLSYSQEPAPLGTAGALRMALPHTRSPTCMVMNGDSYCAADLRDAWRWHESRQAKATVVLTHVSDTSRYGRVDLREGATVSGFAEKSRASGAGWINAGIYILDRALIAEFPEGHNLSLERDVFPQWVQRGLSGYRSHGQFIDIGTPESYAAAQELFGSSSA